jgi:phosphatidylinositol alpha-1,6-mannosyltransferase
VLDGRTGFLVDAEPEPLAAAITTLLGDRRLASRMGAAGHQWVRDAWSWDTSAAQLGALLALDGSEMSEASG